MIQHITLQELRLRRRKPTSETRDMLPTGVTPIYYSCYHEATDGGIYRKFLIGSGIDVSHIATRDGWGLTRRVGRGIIVKACVLTQSRRCRGMVLQRFS